MRLNKANHVAAIVVGAALTIFTGTAIAQHRDDEHGRQNEHAQQKERAEYHFRQEDRGQFRSHYQSNIRDLQKHPDRRHHLHAGEELPSDYRGHLKAVPSSYYRHLPPPPRGYRFGYYDGYVVAYNPTTRVIADVLDLVDAASH